MWPAGAGPAPGVLMAVSLCRVEDEDLRSVSFVFLSLSDDDVNFHISIVFLIGRFVRIETFRSRR